MITIRESLVLLYPLPPTRHGIVMTNLPRSSADLAVSAPSLQACDITETNPILLKRNDYALDCTAKGTDLQTYAQSIPTSTSATIRKKSNVS